MNDSTQGRLVFHRYDYAAFLTYFSYAASSLVVPVALVQIAGALNFHLDQGGLGAGGFLQMGRTISMTLFLVLSGFIAGKMGLRRSMGLSCLLMGLGCFAAAFSRSYLMIFLAVLMAGAGEGYVEAVATPFVQKLHRTDTARYMNFAHSFWSVGVTVTTIGAGIALLAGVSWRIVVGCAFLLAAISALSLLLPEQKGHEYPEDRSRMSFSTTAKLALAIMRVPRFWLFFLLLFIAGGSEYCLTFWLASFLQLSLKASALLGGAATAAFALGMVTGRMGWGILIPQKKLGLSLLCAGIAGVLLSCLIPFLDPAGCLGRTGTLLLLFLLLYLIGITIAPLWPSLQTYSVDRLPEGLDETMIFILLSCAGVPGCGFFTTLMGVIGDQVGLTAAFFLVPACELLLALCLLWEIRHPLPAEQR